MQAARRRLVVALAITLLVATGITVARAADPERQIDINTASVAELTTLPGIGESKAKAIVEHRAAAPFKSVDDLKKVKGIGDRTFETLKPSITVGSTGSAGSMGSGD